MIIAAINGAVVSVQSCYRRITVKTLTLLSLTELHSILNEIYNNCGKN